ncbi:DeoR/GlpR family DNA-binding transcription regulator [Mucilaginibacter ginkgonis]|uniref:DeoR/GlpR transcriptional regulator n=1 Tax=Mucilaginibacter ginkgonis TaxID=2682091 RepID=A0A6I4HZ43_9SPHI|nr:DeoR/GlpR family DNA-binding transcription regulator [Mucilaginibacter ginkgonis]QQL49264.1 DeoR/GlpR transcriptional regulator [Mucilaginibacter ginkgonis]
MSYQKRRQKILALLDEVEEADIAFLREKLSVSEITIRRDLKLMAQDGLLYRTHGGATMTDPLLSVKSFKGKSATNVAAKDAICRRAAEEIVDGDIIFMDCGSSVFRLCQFIKQKKIKVITNSLPVVTELHGTQVAINLIGGEVDTDRQAIHGIIAQEHIKRYRATKAFLGVDGVSVNGLFAQSEKEAANTLAMMSQSKRNYMLCDETKIGKETYLKFAGLESINVIITNADDEKLKEFSKSGVELIKVKS